MTDTMRACSPDEPVMIAWKAYQATDDYKNTRNWALHEKHVDGSLWAAFSHGFYTAMEAARRPDPEADEDAIENAMFAVNPNISAATKNYTQAVCRKLLAALNPSPALVSEGRK